MRRKTSIVRTLASSCGHVGELGQSGSSKLSYEFWIGQSMNAG